MPEGMVDARGVLEQSRRHRDVGGECVPLRRGPAPRRVADLRRLIGPREAPRTKALAMVPVAKATWRSARRSERLVSRRKRASHASRVRRTIQRQGPRCALLWRPRCAACGCDRCARPSTQRGSAAGIRLSWAVAPLGLRPSRGPLASSRVLKLRQSRTARRSMGPRASMPSRHRRTGLSRGPGPGRAKTASRAASP